MYTRQENYNKFICDWVNVVVVFDFLAVATAVGGGLFCFARSLKFVEFNTVDTIAPVYDKIVIYEFIVVYFVWPRSCSMINLKPRSYELNISRQLYI